MELPTRPRQKVPDVLAAAIRDRADRLGDLDPQGTALFDLIELVQGIAAGTTSPDSIPLTDDLTGPDTMDDSGEIHSPTGPWINPDTASVTTPDFQLLWRWDTETGPIGETQTYYNEREGRALVKSRQVV